MADYPMVVVGGGPSSYAKKRKRSGSYGKKAGPSAGVQGPRMQGGQFYARDAAPRMYMARTPGGQITADNHYFDTERSATTIASNVASWTGSEYDPDTTAMLSLFNPIQGNDIASREGRKVFVKKIRVYGVLTVPTQSGATTADPEANVRIILYQDMQTNGTQSQGEDVIESGNGSDAIHMFMNLKNLGRFKVWHDKFYVITQRNISGQGAGNTIEQCGASRNFKISIKPNCYVNYNAVNGGTVADVVDNSWHIIANVQATSLATNIAYKVRTVFVA